LIVSERNTTQQIGSNEQIRFALYRFADIIVPNSYSQENFIKTSYPQLAKKVVTITNFVDTDYFKPAAKKAQNSTPTIISVGRITPQKNILNYLSALRILVEKGLKFKAIWFGNTDQEDYFQSCNLSIEKLGLRDYFEFRPATKEIKNEYQKADIFCLPSIFEGFPNVLCEAMCCGLPVACSNICDNPLIVQQGVNGRLFNPIIVEEMASAIEEMINFPETGKELMCNSNRGKAIEMFSEKIFIERYIQIIK
jgi:glycosyltransferase involved in cell wall biosynthesis